MLSDGNHAVLMVGANKLELYFSLYMNFWPVLLIYLAKKIACTEGFTVFAYALKPLVVK